MRLGVGAKHARLYDWLRTAVHLAKSSWKSFRCFMCEWSCDFGLSSGRDVKQ